MQDTEYNMSVKKTSLQGEVDTLVSTLKQLTILKHEAQRKLDDLDAQVSTIWQDIFGLLKFMYSEKATKFCEISTNYLTGST